MSLAETRARRARLGIPVVVQRAPPAAIRTPRGPIDRDYERAWAAALLGLSERGPPSVREIMCATADHFGIDDRDLLTCSRQPPRLQARQVAIYLARKLTARTFAEISRCFGKRDHTAARYAANQAERLIGTNPEVAAAIDRIREALGCPSPGRNLQERRL